MLLLLCVHDCHKPVSVFGVSRVSAMWEWQCLMPVHLLLGLAPNASRWYGRRIHVCTAAVRNGAASAADQRRWGGPAPSAD